MKTYGTGNAFGEPRAISNHARDMANHDHGYRNQGPCKAEFDDLGRDPLPTIEALFPLAETSLPISETGFLSSSHRQRLR